MELNTQKVTTFLTFSGEAEEAMNFYADVFDESRVVSLIRQANGKVLHATFTVKNHLFMCIDSPIKHEWTFTPGVSLFVNCDSGEEIERVFEKLSDGGQVRMPLSDSPFSEKFGWVDDRYGVSWQLNLAKTN
ncbi:VOC family protein [Cohnella herbarum]|uniref:VOC family protein n=1 Tax=Cohnella herbarum TaxID=2728023 RepID=A0A7Z2VJT8_9BACL|nr:VOC family protein [Cohnella herbarum]QJD84573.1 VOC family protein [Cohnella herbarum]